MIALVAALVLAAPPPDPALIPGSPTVFVGHQQSVVAVAFSPDGKTIASSGFDKTVRVWDVATQKELLKLSGAKDNVASIAFSPDGKLLAAGDAGLTVNLWSLPDGKPVRVMHNAEPIFAIAFSPDGKLLAAGGISGTGEVYQVADGKELYEVRTRVPSFTKDSKQIVGVSHGGAVLTYETAKGKQTKEVKGTTPTSSVLSADGKQLFAYSGNDKEVIVADAVTGARVGVLSGATQGVSAVAASADGKRIAVASVDKFVRIYDAATRTLLSRVPLERTGFVAFSPDRAQLLVGDGAVVKLFPLPKDEK